MTWTPLAVSLKLALWTCLLLLPAATALARLLAWSRFRGRAIVEAAVLLPLVLPPTVLGTYLLLLLAPSSWLGAALGKLGIGPLTFTFQGLLVGSLLFNLPFAVQPMQRAFEAIPDNVREAAWTSGLSHWETFRRIELPLAWPGIVTALALVFAHTLGEFGVVLMIGGNIPGETETVSIAIYDRMQAFRTGEAVAMSAVLLALSLAAIALVQLTARRRGLRHG